MIMKTHLESVLATVTKDTTVINDKEYFNYLISKYTKILNNIPKNYQDKIKYYQDLIKEIKLRLLN